MNVHAPLTRTKPEREAESLKATRLKVADCDLHPTPNSIKDLFPFMEKRWRDHFESFGARRRQGIFQGPAYPKGQPEAARRDAWPRIQRNSGVRPRCCGSLAMWCWQWAMVPLPKRAITRRFRLRVTRALCSGNCALR